MNKCDSDLFETYQGHKYKLKNNLSEKKTLYEFWNL